jgi:type I restriction enzyme S subunit
MAKIGSCGKVGIYPPERPVAIIPANLLKVSLNRYFALKYVYYFFASSFFQEALKTIIKATAQPAFGVTNFKRLPMPIAPTGEQDRIVSEIEKQFTRLDAATAALKRVQANLKRYRASVLKAACEGRLVPTEAELARKEGRDYEPADKLLQRILRERRARWEADTLAKMHASGKPPKDDHWKQKYSIPEPPDNTGLGGLPEGWSWASPDQLSAADDNAICAGPFGTIFKAKDFRSEGVPIIFLRHVSAGRYVTHKPGFMDLQIWEELFRPYSVFGGELLITKLGDPPGVCAIYPEDSGPAMVTPDVIKMSVNASGVQARYLMHYINSDQARQFSTGACFGTTRLRLTLPIFRTIPVALPPISEQVRIADEIDRHLSNADALSNSAVSQLLRTTALRQSVLRSAFTGQLVPQDPSDEPAAALLERIRAERANQSRHTAALNAKQKPRTARQRGAK